MGRPPTIPRPAVSAVWAGSPGGAPALRWLPRYSTPAPGSLLLPPWPRGRGLPPSVGGPPTPRSNRLGMAWAGGWLALPGPGPPPRCLAVGGRTWPPRRRPVNPTYARCGRGGWGAGYGYPAFDLGGSAVAHDRLAPSCTLVPSDAVLAALGHHKHLPSPFCVTGDPAQPGQGQRPTLHVPWPDGPRHRDQKRRHPSLQHHGMPSAACRPPTTSCWGMGGCLCLNPHPHPLLCRACHTENSTF